MTDLHELMREEVAHVGGDLDLDRVLAGGRRRTRVRRALVGTAALAAVGVVAGSVMVGAALRTGPGPEPAQGTAPVGPVLHLADARAPEPGEVTPVASVRNEDLDRTNGTEYVGVTDDGLLLRSTYVEDERRLNLFRWELVDPERGTTTPVGERENLGRPVLLGERRLVFETATSEVGDPVGVSVYDRASGDWSRLTWPALGRESETMRSTDVDTGEESSIRIPVMWRLQAGPDEDRLLAMRSPSDDRPARLWSLSLDDPADVRELGLTVGDFDVADGSLVYSRTSDGPNDRISVRDLSTGATSSFDPRSGSTCNLLGLAATRGHVVTSSYCGEKGGVRDDRVQVLTDDGVPVVTVQGSGMELAQATDAGVLIDAQGTGAETDGSYFYRYADGALLRLNDGMTSWSRSLLAPDDTDLVMWDEPIGGPGTDGMASRGVEYVVARVR